MNSSLNNYLPFINSALLAQLQLLESRERLRIFRLSNRVVASLLNSVKNPLVLVLNQEHLLLLQKKYHHLRKNYHHLQKKKSHHHLQRKRKSHHHLLKKKKSHHHHPKKRKSHLHHLKKRKFHPLHLKKKKSRHHHLKKKKSQSEINFCNNTSYESVVEVTVPPPYGDKTEVIIALSVCAWNSFSTRL